MKCPMLTMYAITLEKPDNYKDRDCLEAECAWWDPDDKQCCIYRAMVELYCLNKQIGTLLLKLGKWVKK